MTALKQSLVITAFALVMAFGWMTTVSAGNLRPMGALSEVIEGENDIAKVHYRHRRCHRHRSRKKRHCHTYRRHSHRYHQGHHRRHHGHHRSHYWGPQFYIGRHGLSFGFGL